MYLLNHCGGLTRYCRCVWHRRCRRYRGRCHNFLFFVVRRQNVHNLCRKKPQKTPSIHFTCVHSHVNYLKQKMSVFRDPTFLKFFWGKFAQANLPPVRVPLPKIYIIAKHANKQRTNKSLQQMFYRSFTMIIYLKICISHVKCGH